MTDLEKDHQKIKDVLDAGFDKAVEAAQRPYKDWMQRPKFPSDELTIQIIGSRIRALEDENATLKNDLLAKQNEAKPKQKEAKTDKIPV